MGTIERNAEKSERVAAKEKSIRVPPPSGSPTIPSNETGSSLMANSFSWNRNIQSFRFISTSAIISSLTLLRMGIRS